MAVLTKADFLTRVKEHIGDDTSDTAMQFIEDMTDTFNDLETRSNNADTENWKAKFEENDKMWRQRYKERFFSDGTTADKALAEQKDDVIDDGNEKTFDDLFVEREG